MDEHGWLGERLEEKRDHLRAVAFRMLGSLSEADDPDVVVRVDASVAVSGAPVEIHGARTWAKGAIAFSQAVRFAQPALVDGEVGIVVAPRGRLFRVLRFTIVNGQITRVEVVADPTRLRELDLAVVHG